jgi:hypothetical protein
MKLFSKINYWLFIILIGSFVLLEISCNNEPVVPIILIDTDNDGIEDALDNCPDSFNPNQEDANNNNIGDICENTNNDTDNDGIEDVIDNCPNTFNPNQEDADNDGIGNLCDSDYTEPIEPLAYCENGFANIYPCSGYDLMAHIPLSTMGAVEGNDSWGWTDPTTGREYALVGTDANTSFVDITLPNNPIYLGSL